MAALKLQGPLFHSKYLFIRKAAKMSTSALSHRHNLNVLPYTTPKFLYGTAWKKEQTADLVYEALRAGFPGIDTAAQPRHYNEKLVGDGLKRAIREGIVKREDLFIQTKYTPISGQDPENLPYDPSLPIPDQIHASIASSLLNLSIGTDSTAYIDSIVLHSPLRTADDTVLAMQTLASYQAAGQIRSIGIANVSFGILSMLVTTPGVKPSIVQNRFIGRTGFDSKIRRLCREHSIIYQSFWTLTGNPELLMWPEIGLIGNKVGVSKEAALYALVIGLEGVTILNGTTNTVTMTKDLEGVEKIGKWAEGEGKEDWEKLLKEFREAVGDV